MSTNVSLVACIIRVLNLLISFPFNWLVQVVKWRRVQLATQAGGRQVGAYTLYLDYHALAVTHGKEIPPSQCMAPIQAYYGDMFGFTVYSPSMQLFVETARLQRARQDMYSPLTQSSEDGCHYRLLPGSADIDIPICPSWWANSGSVLARKCAKVCCQVARCLGWLAPVSPTQYLPQLT